MVFLSNLIINHMARPSNKAMRALEILDAFEWCVAKYGVEGSTLEKIAERAKLARALIRHHIGNKEALIQLLVERVIDKSNQAVCEMMAQLPDEDRCQVLISFLFDESNSNQQLILVFSALITAANDRPDMAEKLNAWVQNFIHQIAKQIKQQYPQHPSESIYTVASGIIGIYFNVDSLSTLGDISHIRVQSKAAASLLVESLDQSSPERLSGN